MSCTSRPLILALALAALSGCAQDRLLSIDYYHVEFDPDPGWTPSQRASEAQAWRDDILTRAGSVSASVSTSQVYGDSSLWGNLLDPAAAPNSVVTRCRAKDTDSKSFKVVPGGQPQQLIQARVIADPGDLTHEDISPAEPCDVGINRQLQALEIVAEPFALATPKKAGFTTYQVLITTSFEPWASTTLNTLIGTFDPGDEKGAAQFTFVAVRQSPNWQTTFEDVIIVPRGSYFGDVKTP